MTSISHIVFKVWQNHWTVKYRSLRCTVVMRPKAVSHCLIIANYDVHPANSLKDIRQNHWTMKYRSCWYRSQRHKVDWCLTSYIHNLFVEQKKKKTFQKCPRCLASCPTLEYGHWGQVSWNESWPSRVPLFQIWMLSGEWWSRYELLINLHVKLQCEGNVNADYNSSPCISCRRAKNDCC